MALLKINKLVLLMTVLLNDAIILSEDIYFAPSLFLNHGGGPLPVLGEVENREIANFLKNVPHIVDLKRLKAIIVVTAHRQEDRVTISSGRRNNLFYDYSYFPRESYKLKYDAHGDPDLARKIYDAFKSKGIAARLDDIRGWDHGVFIPMMLINPKADIPIIQVSILKNQNAQEHLNIGKVLYKFRKEGVAIFGSGMSYHNMVAFKVAYSNHFRDAFIVNDIFDGFLTRVCTAHWKNREDIVNWAYIPQALDSHPPGKADHLMPLIVNIGAAGKSPGRKVFETVFLKRFKLSAFIWDEKN